MKEIVKKYPVFIYHNPYGYANPGAISINANEVVFDMQKISSELQEKVFGKNEIVELTIKEMNEIANAQRGISRQVSDSVMKNVGLKKVC